MHQNKRTDVLIIGGGPAGLFLSTLYKKSIILEKEATPGKKLLLTGGGMCNFTHEGQPFEVIEHYFEKKAFVSSCLGKFPPDKIKDYFSQLGLESIKRKDGCVFPKSLKAETLLSCLLDNAGEIITNTVITSIKKEEELFIVETNNGIFISKALVIATGGMSYPGTGSTGDGYKIAKSFGHNLLQPSPALSEIKLSFNTQAIEGVSLQEVELKIGNKTSKGPLLFTKRGISGPAAMFISREIQAHTLLTIKFAELEERELIFVKGTKSVKNVVKELTSLPLTLISTIVPFCDKQCSTLTKEERKAVLNSITAFCTEATTTGLLKIATVTRGGVDTNQINKKNFESKLVSNLFFIGEVLDVDGECGGYNLTFCFASAYSVASALLAKHPQQ